MTVEAQFGDGASGESPPPAASKLTLTESFALDALGIRQHALRSGWPDFLVDQNGIVFAIEVKSSGDRVHDHQRATHAVLERAGIPVYTVWVAGQRVERVTREGLPPKPESADVLPEVREHMRRLAAAGARKGGSARARKLTTEQRSASGRLAAQARWGRLTSPSSSPSPTSP